MTLIFKGLLLIYAVWAFIMFNKIHDVVHTVIDEEFHLPQGKAYCNFDFTRWDPKITTLPGLYLWSVMILGPFNICTTYGLRFTNYLVGLINMVLFYIWFYIHNRSNRMEPIRVMSTLNMAIFPPLWFLTNLYYTDALSLMFIMLMLIHNKMNKHLLSANFGLCAVMVRQTNIMWVLMLMSEYLVKQVYHYCMKPNRGRYEIEELDIKELRLQHLENYYLIKNMTMEAWINFYAYGIPSFVFALFVFLNNGIVMGDKSAHVTAIHIPQFFYFCLFCVFFAWPIFFNRVIPFLRFLKKRFFLAVLICALMAVAIYYNTLVHPYLLADNRHYTFYIWNRYYQKYPSFRYWMIPVYLFGLYSIITRVYMKENVTIAFFYVPFAFTVLILQRMIEVRYFLVPFILMRLRAMRTPMFWLVMEFCFYLYINYKTVNIFFDKNIFWPEYNYAQKLIW